MIYRDLPVFVGLANQPPSSINNNYYLMASQVSIDMAAGAEAKRKINQPIDQYDQFTHPDPLLCRISFQCYIPGSNIESFNSLDFNTPSDLSWAAKVILNQSTGNNYHPIRIGGNVFDKCYLDSYTVDISPLKPVTLSANFICNNPPTGTSILSTINGIDSFIGTKNFSNKIIHGHTCTVSGVDDVVSNIQSSIKYQVTCDRTPLYQVNSIMPSLMMLNNVERQMDIDSTDINKIINQEGSTLIKPISVGLRYEKDYSITAYLNMNAGSKLLSQKINMQEADTLSTQVSIKEVLNISKDALSFPTISESYTISVNPTSVNEGGIVTFNVTTANVPDSTTLYYYIKHISTNDDDFNGQTLGNFLIQNNQGSFSITTKTDFLNAEPSETFKVVITNAIFEQLWESQAIEIRNIDNPATYTLSENKITVNENGTVIFTVNTNLANNSKIYYDIAHITTSPSDFIGPTSGELIIQNGTASFVIETNPDLSTEGNQTFKAVIKNTLLQEVVASNTITITDSSLGVVPTYTITSGGITSVNEGNSISFLVTTTNVDNGTILNYDVENITSQDTDFTSKSGQITIQGGTATFNISIKPDLITEPGASETFKAILLDGLLEKIQQSSTITIVDSSTTPVPGYVITQSPITTVSEGSTITFTVTTTNVSSGTTLYYNIDYNGSTDASDFVGNTSGSIVTLGNIATFTITAKADSTTEGSQTFKMKVLTGSISGTLVKTSDTITISDTSLNPVPTYSVSPSPSNITSVDEGNSVTFLVTTTLVNNGTTLYYTINYNGSTNASDFTGNTSGSIIINSNAATFTIATNADSTTEGDQTFKVDIRTVSASGTIVATSNAIIIKDTSQTPAPTYTVSPSTTLVGEDENITFTVTTTNVNSGTTLYYSVQNISTTNADFVNTSGSMTVNGSNTATFTITTTYDTDFAESDETFNVAIKTGSVNGNIVRTSEVITIKPSSQTNPPSPTWYKDVSFVALTTDNSSHGVSINGNGNRIAFCSTTDKNIYTRKQISPNNWIFDGTISLGAFTFSGDDFFQTALSDDGNILAINRRNTTINAGVARIYFWDGSSWTQRGNDISTIAYYSNVSVSGDGNTIAISEPNLSRVKVYSWSGSSWQQLGNTITSSGEFGHKVTLNYTGNVIGVSTRATGSGVDVYELISSTWSTRNIRSLSGYTILMAANIDGIKINDDGNIIAIAGYIGSLQNPYDSTVPVIGVFRWKKSNNTWVRMGSYIYTSGGNYGNPLPDITMSMDSTASRIIWSEDVSITFGASYSIIRVVDWNGEWYGEADIHPSPTTNNNNGRSMALSANGKAIVYGSTLQDSVVVYQSTT